MRRRWLMLMIGVGVLGVGGYAGYTYSVHVIADKLSTQLLAEAEGNQQWLEQSELPALQMSSGEASLDKAANSDKSEKSSSNTAPADSSMQEGNVPSKVTTSAASTGSNAEASTERKGNEQAASSFGSKQEAVKFVMSRFSAGELNKLRQMASGGLTSEEKSELKKIAYSKFTAAEIAAVQKAVTTK